jgi:hypothetical protein
MTGGPGAVIPGTRAPAMGGELLGSSLVVVTDGQTAVIDETGCHSRSMLVASARRAGLFDGQVRSEKGLRKALS